ncbi:glutamine-hydrolyzing carbamoyl-phosphate synthase small subunit [Robiginitomaculum antarcticum]|uniref:glutamine-hydrolyzing carbamoyl-phosphate synthase small subunit n=1 Tax=Robiginitomaculum antarcticum TaxID=437507 RepID=UPI0003813E0B|nr:glutamine-hydrolyzing carbamoyl-phosphate synthase small subunit [Robiginitomaculum antarcticum]
MSLFNKNQAQPTEDGVHNPYEDLTKAPTGVLVLADGTVFYGRGAGYQGEATGEVCFNTAMTGYQEILTDPSYSDQIVCFTFPHIGNVGTNDADDESFSVPARRAAVGAIFKAPITVPSNYRNEMALPEWMAARKIIGLSGIDTRALTAHIRDHGMPNGVIAHHVDGQFDLGALKSKAADWQGLVGAELAEGRSTPAQHTSHVQGWSWDEGHSDNTGKGKHVVVIDYGVKGNIVRRLGSVGLRCTIVPARTLAADILALNPDGVVLSNGPGDPVATGEYALPVIRDLVASDTPLLGICLGHQLLALAMGAKTVKMAQGHHGANHPVKDFTTGKVEIVSMNHGFAVDKDSLPDTVEETHVSLFDGTNCGIKVKGKPVFSVQHHPEASPGPQDSFYLFQRFADTL